MKVEFLKDHLDYKTKDVADIDDGIATYLVGAGVVKEARPAKEEPAKKATPKKKEAGEAKAEPPAENV